MTDRRDHRARAVTFHRVVEHLHRGGLQLDHLPDDQLSPAAVQRIVQRLAVRGLARVTESGWEPRPVLLHDQSEMVTTA